MDIITSEDIERLVRIDVPWGKLKGKRILLTGGRGGICSYIIFLLLKANKEYDLGITVIAMCRDKEKSKSWFQDYLDDPCFSLFIHDVCDSFENIIKADVIFHMTNVKGVFSHGCQIKPYSIFESNVLGFHNVIVAAKKWRAEKVILFSSAAVYGAFDEDGVDESYRGVIDYDNVQNIYIICKQMMECMAYAMNEQDNIDVRIIRPFNVYGPCMGGATKGNHMTDFIRDYIIGKELVINGDGTAQRAYCYVADAVEAVVRIWLMGDKDPYNLSGEHVASIRDFATIISSYKCKYLPVTVLSSDSAKRRQNARIYAGNDKRLKELGWKEHYSLLDGIGRTIEWAKNGSFMDE